MATNEYECPDCDGDGTAECEYCGHEIDCEACDGSGLDPDMIDLARWNPASEALTRETGMSCEWSENGIVLGRKNDKRTLAYSDYLKQ